MLLIKEEELTKKQRIEMKTKKKFQKRTPKNVYSTQTINTKMKIPTYEDKMSCQEEPKKINFNTINEDEELSSKCIVDSAENELIRTNLIQESQNNEIKNVKKILDDLKRELLEQQNKEGNSADSSSEEELEDESKEVLQMIHEFNDLLNKETKSRILMKSEENHNLNSLGMKRNNDVHLENSYNPKGLKGKNLNLLN